MGKGAAFMETVLLFLSLIVVFFGAEYVMRKILKVEKVDLSKRLAERSATGEGELF